MGVRDIHTPDGENEYTDFEIRVAEILHQRHRWRWRALSMWIIAFSAAVILGFHYIQKSRLESCRHIYASHNEVFQPFFPPPSQQTPQQKHNLKLLHETVRDLITTCPQQVNAGILEGKWGW